MRRQLHGAREVLGVTGLAGLTVPMGLMGLMA